jgi:hypothetical protein
VQAEGFWRAVRCRSYRRGFMDSEGEEEQELLHPIFVYIASRL